MYMLLLDRSPASTDEDPGLLRQHATLTDGQTARCSWAPAADVADVVTGARKKFSAATRIIQHHRAAGCSQYREFGRIPALTWAACSDGTSVMPVGCGPGWLPEQRELIGECRECRAVPGGQRGASGALQRAVAIVPAGRQRGAEPPVQQPPDECERSRVRVRRRGQADCQVEVVDGRLDGQRGDEVRRLQ